MNKDNLKVYSALVGGYELSCIAAVVDKTKNFSGNDSKLVGIKQERPRSIYFIIL
jgi:hypothetical protein